MKIFYWSPFFSKIATISAVLNSAKSLIKYRNKNDYEVSIINAIGEWDDYKELSNNKINFKNITKKNLVNFLPKGGFLKVDFLIYLYFFLVSLNC